MDLCVCQSLVLPKTEKRVVSELLLKNYISTKDVRTKSYILFALTSFEGHNEVFT